MSSCTVLVKKLDPEAIIPTRATSGSAGWDLYALRDYLMEEHEIVETGLAMDIPLGFMGMIFVRSGLGFKKKITVSNSSGIIDSDYRGPIKIALSDLKKECQIEEIKKGDRVAQIIFVEVPTTALMETKKLSETERGEKGIGSSGR